MHRTRAYRYAYGLTKDPDEASELLAETFARIVRSIEGFHGQCTFMTWFYRILSHCFFDSQKRPARRLTTSLTDLVRKQERFPVPELSCDGEVAIDSSASARKSDILSEGLRRMPDSARTILLLYHVKNFAYEEIAETLNIPVGTVKSRLNRARLALRDIVMWQEEALVERP